MTKQKKALKPKKPAKVEAPKVVEPTVQKTGKFRKWKKESGKFKKFKKVA